MGAGASAAGAGSEEIVAAGADAAAPALAPLLAPMVVRRGRAPGSKFGRRPSNVSSAATALAASPEAPPLMSPATVFAMGSPDSVGTSTATDNMLGRSRASSRGSSTKTCPASPAVLGEHFTLEDLTAEELLQRYDTKGCGVLDVAALQRMLADTGLRVGKLSPRSAAGASPGFAALAEDAGDMSELDMETPKEVVVVGRGPNKLRLQPLRRDASLAPRRTRKTLIQRKVPDPSPGRSAPAVGLRRAALSEKMPTMEEPWEMPDVVPEVTPTTQSVKHHRRPSIDTTLLGEPGEARAPREPRLRRRRQPSLRLDLFASDGVEDTEGERLDPQASVIRHWRKGELIGKGAYGRVYMGFNEENGEILAVKELPLPARRRQRSFGLTRQATIAGGETSEDTSLIAPKPYCFRSPRRALRKMARDTSASSLSAGGSARSYEDEIEALEREIELMRSVQHEHIVSYRGTDYSDDGAFLYIFTEWVPAGSLVDLRQRFGPLPESVTRTYARQILAGLRYLHDAGIVHRDVKPANVLVDRDGRIRLADFGSAKRIRKVVGADEQQPSSSPAPGESARPVSNDLSCHGTPYYMAPEVILQLEEATAKCDIWSLGCTVLYMSSGAHPWKGDFPDAKAVALLVRIAQAERGPTLRTPADAAPASMSLRSFLEACFVLDPLHRPSSATLADHSFIQEAAPSFTPRTFRAIRGRHPRTPTHSSSPATRAGAPRPLVSPTLSPNDSPRDSPRRLSLRAASPARTPGRRRRNSSIISPTSPDDCPHFRSRASVEEHFRHSSSSSIETPRMRRAQAAMERQSSFSCEQSESIELPPGLVAGAEAAAQTTFASSDSRSVSPSSSVSSRGGLDPPVRRRNHSFYV